MKWQRVISLVTLAISLFTLVLVVRRPAPEPWRGILCPAGNAAARNAREGPEITQWLDRFHTTGVPLTVIFPANRPYEPIVISGVFTKGQLLSKLKEAVAIPKSKKATTAQSDVDRRGAAISRE